LQQQTVKYYVNSSLLLLDWLGYPPIDNREAELLFQVVAARYDSGSIVLTTNCRFLDVGTIIDINSTFATATIDRLVHYREAYVLQGTSYRTKDNTHDAE